MNIFASVLVTFIFIQTKLVDSAWFFRVVPLEVNFHLTRMEKGPNKCHGAHRFNVKPRAASRTSDTGRVYC